MGKKLILRLVILILSLVFIIIGLLRGEGIEVFQKGTQICLSCIGIG